MQKKLEMSFHKIDNLEKDLFMKDQMMTNGGQKMNQSAIHFTYNLGGSAGGLQNDSMANYTQPLNFSTVVDKEKENLSAENKELKRSN